MNRPTRVSPFSALLLWAVPCLSPGSVFAHESYLDWHRPTYFIARYNANETGGVEEAKLQISIRTKLFRGGPASVQLAYTQRSLWDVGRESSPFLTTDFNPELYLEIVPASLRVPFVRIGYEHESNGVSEDHESRSWNRGFLSIRLAAGTATQMTFGDPGEGTGWGAYLDAKGWVFDAQGEEKDLFDRYAGYWEIEADFSYRAAPRRYGVFRCLLGAAGLDVRLRGLPIHEGDRGFLEAGARVALARRMHAYVQYFRGYGELMTFFDQDGWQEGIFWMGLRFGP